MSEPDRHDVNIRALQEMVAVLWANWGGFRVIRGIVSSAGAVVGGEGFSSVKTGTGDYTLTWDAPFGDVPAVVVTANGAADRVTNAEPTTTTCRVTTDTAETAVTLIDTKFNFVAIGPVA